jgi:hypothetical protein
VHQGGLMIFRLMVQDLFNVEQFIIEKSVKSKIKFLGKLRQDLGVARKPLMIGYFGDTIS